MAKTRTEIQRTWMEKLYLRSSFFVDADRRRRSGLKPSDGCSPEEAVIQRFFCAYPRCFTLPTGVDITPDALIVFVDDGAHTRVEAAAAIVALSEVSSAKVVVQSYGDGKSSSYSPADLAHEIDQVRGEADKMRRIGIWMQVAE